MRNYLIAILSILSVASFAQDTLFGYAPDYAGEKVKLYTYQDYITRTRVVIGEGEVSKEDSIFRIELNNKGTLKGIVEIEKSEAEIYLAPKTSYQVYYEKPYDQPLSFNNQHVSLIFFGLDTADINYRIMQYNIWFDTFISYYHREIAAGLLATCLDTFKISVAEKYKDVQDEYFLTHVRYNIADVEQTLTGQSGKNRLDTYLEYIEPYPIYYENEQYMQFVLNFYHMDFEDYPPEMEANMFGAIQIASPTLLMRHMGIDLLLERPDIREMVMIDKLGKLFYNDNRSKANVLVMLDSLAGHALNIHDAAAAKNVKNYLTSLEPGFPAPLLNVNYNDSTLTWNSYSGRYVYLNFFSTWSDQSLLEMKVIDSLEEKYGNDISFLSICTDAKRKTYDQYLKDHPDMDWDIVYVGENDPLLTNFRVETYPQYFLIDQSGFIVAAPAPGPAPNGEYESIEKTLFTIQQALNPGRTFRTGQY